MTPAVVTDDAGLAALWPAWDALWHETRGSPFLAPGWLRPWWAEFGTGRPVVAVLGDGSRMMGVLPLYRLGDKLLPMGVGLGDEFDVLVRPGVPAAPLLAAALDAGGTARCDLPELTPEARLHDVAAPRGWTRETWPGAPNPILPLAGELRETVPKGMLRDLRQARNRAERSGGWEVEEACGANADRFLDELVRLHRLRWRERGEAGVLADERVLGFHRSAARGLVEHGVLRLMALRLRGTVAAAIHALLDADRILFYLGGFDPACRFESPGTILIGAMLERAIAEGRRQAAFLRGDEAYKYAWGAVHRCNVGCSFSRR